MTLQAPRQRKPGLQRGQEHSAYSPALEFRVDKDVMDVGLRYIDRQEPHETTFRAVINEHGLALRRTRKVRIGFDRGRKPFGAADGTLIESLDGGSVPLLELTDLEHLIERLTNERNVGRHVSFRGRS